MRCLGRIFSCFGGLAVLLGLALAALYLLVFPRLDTIFADSVRREFMLPPSSTVKMTRGSLLDTLQGRVPEMLVEAEEAKIEGLLVEDVRLLAEGVKFDLPLTLATGNAEWQDMSSGRLEFKVSEESLKQRWAGELEDRGLKKVEVKLKGGEVSISGLLDAAIFKLRVGAKGKVEVDGSDRIVFKPSAMELGGADFGVEQINAIFSALTPVLDLGSLKLGVGVESMEPRDGYLYVVANSLKLDELADKMGGADTAEGGTTDSPAAAEDTKNDSDVEAEGSGSSGSGAGKSQDT
ncbi:LmeA family phospholipid-binding protein [bacterium]|nr:LmeA family phospholipid-binding protein [bacterium]